MKIVRIQYGDIQQKVTSFDATFEKAVEDKPVEVDPKGESIEVKVSELAFATIRDTEGKEIEYKYPFNFTVVEIDSRTIDILVPDDFDERILSGTIIPIDKQNPLHKFLGHD